MTECVRGHFAFCSGHFEPANARTRVTRLDPDLACDELAVYIEQTLSIRSLIRPTVERVKATSSYASFHLTCEDPAVLLDACIWLEGSLVRWWREGRQTSSIATSTSVPHQVVAPVNPRNDNLLVDDIQL